MVQRRSVVHRAEDQRAGGTAHRSAAPRLATDADIVATAERELGQALAPIDRALADARYLAGAAFSLADVSAHLVGAHAALADLRHVQRWWAEVSARAWSKIAA